MAQLLDPDATLEFLLEHMEDFSMGQPMDVEAVRSLFCDLNDHLSAGGKLPKAWEVAGGRQQLRSMP